MIKGIFHSSRSMMAAAKNMEIVANNLANLNTVAFKREGSFSEIMTAVGNSQIKSAIDLSQGEIYKTSNTYDLAIVGEGTFVIKTDDGYEFTRNGSFRVSDDGFLINERGQKVMGKKGEINLSESFLNDKNSVLISRQGEVKIGDVSLDELLIVKINPDDYEKRRLGLNFNATEEIQEVVDSEKYQIMQGYLEESNVNPILEMENMINVSKDYETSYKMITYLDHSLEKSNEIGRI